MTSSPKKFTHTEPCPKGPGKNKLHHVSFVLVSLFSSKFRKPLKHIWTMWQCHKNVTSVTALPVGKIVTYQKYHESFPLIFSRFRLLFPIICLVCRFAIAGWPWSRQVSSHPKIITHLLWLISPFHTRTICSDHQLFRSIKEFLINSREYTLKNIR